MGFIALLSDLGHNDTGVAKTKSILLQQLPAMQIIDVTHNIYPYYLQQAAYLLGSSVKDFPQGSFHIVLFDIYYDAQPKMVLAEIGESYILAPDNGVLPLAFPQKEMTTRLCYSMNDAGGLRAWVKAAADAIEILQSTPIENTGFGPCEMQNAAGQFRPFITPGYMEGHVIHIDHFGNVVLNITKDEFEATAAGRAFSVSFIREEVRTISNHYNSVNRFEKLCRFNSAGYMEIAINRGNAAELFALKIKRPEQLMYTTIKINFE